MNTHQTKPRQARCIQFTDPDNLPEGVWYSIPSKSYLFKAFDINVTDWIIDRKEVLSDEEFKKMWEVIGSPNNRQWPTVTDNDFRIIYQALEKAVERLKHHEFHNRELIEVLELILKENRHFRT